MNELFDKLILRIAFTLFICLILFFYRYLHAILYPSSRSQIFKKFYPSLNSADTIHLFSRIIGLGIIFQPLFLNISAGIMIGLLDFLIKGLLGIFLYLCSIYIIESISLYNFEYVDEIVKRKNLSYGIISFGEALALAFIIKTVIRASNGSLIILLFLWLFSLILLGFSIKFYSIVSKLSLIKLVTQKNLAVSFSYSGYFLGCALIIISAFTHDFQNIQSYAVFVALRIILSAIIFPIFNLGLYYVFQLKDADKPQDKSESSGIENPNVGYGVYEGSVFLTSALLTSIITGHIEFGSFYPVL